MNKRLISMDLISGTTIVTGTGITIPELSTGIASIMMGGEHLLISLQVLKETSRRKIDKMLLEKLR